MDSLRVAAESFTYIAVYSACFPSSLSFLYSCSCCCCMSERLVISENPPMCACQRVVVSEYRGQTYHHPPKSIPPPLLHLHTRILVTPSLLIMVGVLIWHWRLCITPHISKQVLPWQFIKNHFQTWQCIKIMLKLKISQERKQCENPIRWDKFDLRLRTKW